MYDAATGDFLMLLLADERFPPPFPSAQVAYFSNDGDHFLIMRRSGTVDVWATDTANSVRRIGTLTGHSLRVTRAKFSDDDHWLATTGSDGLVRFWDFEEMREVASIRATVEHELNDVAFHPVHPLAALQHRDGQLLLLDLESGRPVARWAALRFKDIFFGKNGKKLYIQTDEQVIAYPVDLETRPPEVLRELLARYML